MSAAGGRQIGQRTLHPYRCSSSSKAAAPGYADHWRPLFADIPVGGPSASLLAPRPSLNRQCAGEGGAFAKDRDPSPAATASDASSSNAPYGRHETGSGQFARSYKNASSRSAAAAPGAVIGSTSAIRLEGTLQEQSAADVQANQAAACAAETGAGARTAAAS